MKKVLTVLLAIAVMFTFSFGSAFAATYTYDDYSKALETQKANILDALKSAKSQAVNSYAYNKEGFAGVGDGTIDGYMKAAYEAAADAVIEDAEEAMDVAISKYLGAMDADTTLSTAPDADLLEKQVNDLNEATDGVKAMDLKALAARDAMKIALEAKTEELNKTQLPLTEAAILAKADVDLSKYNSTDKDYTYTAPSAVAAIGTIGASDGTKVSAAEAVSALADDLKAAIADIKAGKLDSATTDADKLGAYEKAYANFNTQFDSIDTLDDEAFGEIGAAATLETALNAYITEGYKSLPDMDNFDSADDTENWASLCKTGYWKEFWEGKTDTSNEGELFGVAIKDIAKVTRTEGMAVYNAMKKAIDDSRKAAEAYAKANETKSKLAAACVEDLYDNSDETVFLTTLKNAMDAAEKYADVVKYGEKMKARYAYGVKKYDDAKVDEAVKAAEEFVYKDLKAGFGTPESYIIAGANEVADNSDGLDNLLREEAKYAYQKFVEAVNDAAEKIYNNGLAKDTPTTEVKVGADKTPEADLVYLKSTYATSQSDDWDDIAGDTIDALNAAQSYDEIDSIMKKAAEDFGKLLKKDDESDVNKAKSAYKNALDGFIAQTKGLLDDEADYSKAFADGVLAAKGAELIDAATTVEGVKAAYAEAQALVTGAKSDDELKDMKKAVEKQINALPATNKLTVADKDAVKAAYDAYVAYIDLAGADEITLSKDKLVQRYNKLNELLAKEIADAAEALVEKLEDVATGSDEDMPKYLAYKAEVQALVDKGNALLDEIADVNEDAYLGAYDKDNKTGALQGVDLGTDFANLEATLCKDIVCDQDCGGNGLDRFYDVEIDYALSKLVVASKTDATAAQIKEALDAFNALTERQQLELNESNPYYYELAQTIADKQGTAVKELKITAKSTAKKGSITVKWTVKGDASNIDGYEIWKSTKQSKGYKKAFTTTKQTYKNSKDLKKGTRYYYKVRAYKMVDGVKITSDWSNKAYRKAK